MVGPFGLRSKGTMRWRALPLARALAEKGYRLTILLPPWDSPQDAGRSWCEGGVRVVNLSLPPQVGGTAQQAALTWQLALAVLRQSPNVVHLFKPKGHSGGVLLALRALRRLGRCRARLVVDWDDWEGDGGWNERAGYSLWLRWLFAWRERWGIRSADTVTVASRLLERRALSLRQEQGGFHYLPNGAEPRALPAVRRHKSLVLWFTRFSECSPARGLQLFQRLRRHAPEARLLIVGAGLSGEERELPALLRTMELAQVVDHRGWLEGDALREALAEASLAMFPMDDTTLNRARCPARLTHLLAAGVPTVAERVGEAGTYMVDGHSGRLIRPGDEDKFAQVLAELLQDEEQRMALSQGAVRRISECFRWARLAVQAEAAYGVMP